MIERHTEDNIADRPQFLDVSDLQALFGVGRSESTSDDGRPALHSSW